MSGFNYKNRHSSRNVTRYKPKSWLKSRVGYGAVGDGDGFGNSLRSTGSYQYSATDENESRSLYESRRMDFYASESDSAVSFTSDELDFSTKDDKNNGPSEKFIEDDSVSKKNSFSHNNVIDISMISSHKEWTTKDDFDMLTTPNKRILFDRILYEYESESESKNDDKYQVLVEGTEKESDTSIESVDTMSAHDVNTYHLYGKDQGTWFTDDRYGSEFYISNSNGTALYYSGTLCGKRRHTAPCDLSYLPAGTYKWRVTGALNPSKRFVAYDFCGVRGTFSSEVVFAINCEGECVPLRVRDLEDVCEALQYIATQETQVTLFGSVMLEGKKGEEINDEDLNVIRTTLAQEFSEASVQEPDKEMVEMLSWRVIPSSQSVGRKLESSSVDSTTTHQIDFRVTVISEHFGVDGAKETGLDGLVEDLSAYLHQSMISGVFTSKLVSNAVSQGVVGLQSVRHARLQSFSAAVRPIHRTSFSSVSNIILICGIISGLLTGMLLFVLLASKSVSYNDTLSMNDDGGVFNPIQHELLRDNITDKINTNKY
mmetsp:Transcript_14452/g.14557  ORF Transcript_14452/g.14557 Transcript_14452/m.14557 type:complete len:542 (+) Transcript_14452:1-1626(+)